MQSVRFEHGIYYPDNHDVPLADIAATLIAHERILPIIGEALEALVPGLVVDDLRINLEKIERSSLKEAFFVALLVVYQKDLEKAVPPLIEALTGSEIDGRYDTLVTVLFMVALYYGAQALFGKMGKGSTPSVPASIVADYARYVDIVSDQLNVSADAVRAAFEKAVGKKRLPAIQRAAIDMFRPAKRGGNGRIVPRGLPEVSQASVGDFPTALTLADLEDDMLPVHLPRARLDIRATDRDKSDKGWAGKVETDELKTRRLPIRLAPGINPDELAGLYRPEVEAFLESRFKDDGTTKPVRIHVFRILYP